MANAPMLTKRRVLVAKIETTVGTQIAVTGSDGVFNVMNARFTPQIEFETREGQGVFSQLPGVPGALGGQVTFSIELIGGASAPAWMSTFLPACGMPLVSLVAGVKSTAPEAASSTTKTLTIAGYQDGQLKVLFGCMGNVVFRFPAGKKCVADFTFTGVWGDPTDATILAPSYPTTAPLKFISSGLTVAAYAPVIAGMTIDLGNTVILRENSLTATGYHSALITGRRPIVTMDTEARLIADWDIHGKRKARTEEALALSMGSAGNALAFAAPKMQITDIQEADRNGLQTEQVTWQLNRSAAAGDDELTLTTS